MKPDIASLSRVQRLTLVGVLLAMATFQVAMLRHGHEWGDDFAMYLLLGRNLAEARPYAETGYLYNPDYPSVGPSTLPPVFPAMLAAIYRTAGLNLDLMKLLGVCAFVGMLAVVAAAPGASLPFAHRLALVAIVGFQPYLTEQAGNILSDLPFMLWIYLTLAAVHMAETRVASARARFGWMLAAGVCMYLAYGTRSAGLMLAPSLVAYDVLRHRRPTWPAMAAIGVFAALACVQSALFHSDAAYAGQMHTDFGVVLGNVWNYSGRLAAYWHNGYSKAASATLTAALVLAAVYGYAAQLRRGITIFAVFPWFYLLPVLAWRSEAGEIRFLMPVFPLFAYYMLSGVAAATASARPRAAHVFLATIVALVAATYAGRFATQATITDREGVTTRQARELFDEVARSTSPSDAIVFIKPRALALFADRRAAAYHAPKHDDDLWHFIDGIHARYLVVVKRAEAMGPAGPPALVEWLKKFVARNPARFVREWENSDFELYRIIPSDQPAGEVTPSGAAAASAA